MDDWVYYAIAFLAIIVIINILNSRSAAFSELERKKRIITELPIDKSDVLKILQPSASKVNSHKSRKRSGRNNLNQGRYINRTSLIDFSKFDDVSPLKLLGYSVGSSGMPKKERQDVLKYSIFGDIQIYMPDGVDYDARWGPPGSQARFEAVARHIRLVRNLRRNRSSMSSAVSDWSDDLSWIDSEHEDIYRFRFFYN
jgi:hypothetical protein